LRELQRATQQIQIHERGAAIGALLDVASEFHSVEGAQLTVEIAVKE